MGNWTLLIEGTGCHHNGKEEIDADLLAPKLVQQLRDQGQTIDHATFTAGGRQTAVPGPTDEYEPDDYDGLSQFP